VLSWGSVFFQLLRVIIATSKTNTHRPSLLFPLTIASLALFIESVYFGITALMSITGNDMAFKIMLESQNWFLVKVLIALSGVLLLFDLKIETKNKKEE
jgi:hypothetical protein